MEGVLDSDHVARGVYTVAETDGDTQRAAAELAEDRNLLSSLVAAERRSTLQIDVKDLLPKQVAQRAPPLSR